MSFQADVALAWADYTASVGIDPEKFSDTEKIAFQAGFAAGTSKQLAKAREQLAEEVTKARQS